MTIIDDATIQTYNGSMHTKNLTSENSYNLIHNGIGAPSHKNITKDENQPVVGESETSSYGRNATVIALIGSETTQTGIDSLGTTVSTETPRDVAFPKVIEKTPYVYPAGSPNVLSAVALVVTASAVTHNFQHGLICFSAGTFILTDHGEVAIENLRVGDPVMTADHGLQLLRWIGTTVLDSIELQVHSNLRPIRIKAEALGRGIPITDLLVSPQHRILVRSKIARKMFGVDEVLVAAKQLLQIDGIDIRDSADGVEYYHMLFDLHEVVFANGAEAESLYTGPEEVRIVGTAASAEIFKIFPKLREKDYAPQSARTLLSGRMGRKLVSRHLQHKKPLVGMI